MPQMPDPSNTTVEELLMLRNYVSELTARHNALTRDTTKEFFKTAQYFEKISAWTIEADRKLTCCE